MPKKAKTVQVPLNRVEGDLEIRAEVADGQVVDAWVAGTMFRGFENLMIDRGALDGLVLTPRICGICSTSHLYAAALALDRLSGAMVPDNAIRMRNVALMAEHLQSDLRQAFLMFAVDFAHDCYRGRAFHPEAVERYTPFHGSTVIEVVRQTKRVLEIVALIGGQWPHSSFMVPGGIVSVPSAADLRQSRLVLRQLRAWYETRILGGPLSAWQQVRTLTDLEAWCADPAHAAADLAFVFKTGKELGLDRIGGGQQRFLSCGSLPLPSSERQSGASHLFAAGLWEGGQAHPFAPGQISEDIACSWFTGKSGGCSPAWGMTRPEPDKPGAAYSWVKAPRYAHLPAETSPLGELLLAGQPLLGDWLKRRGSSALVREVARIIRTAELLPSMEQWLTEAGQEGEYYQQPQEISSGHGCGLTQASRGALGHWLEIDEGRIKQYQVVTPTSWNASPRDQQGVRGPIEQALIGAPVADENHPIELGHIVRSFDPCLVCAVHTLHRGEPRRRLRIGIGG